MFIDINKCSDNELWELLTDLSLIIDSKQNKKSNIYFMWCDLFKAVRKEIDKRLNVDYEK